MPSVPERLPITAQLAQSGVVAILRGSDRPPSRSRLADAGRGRGDLPGAHPDHAGRGRRAGAGPGRAEQRRGARHGQRDRRRPGGGVPGRGRRLPGQPRRVRRGARSTRPSTGWPAIPAAGPRPSCSRRGGWARRRSSCSPRHRAARATSRTCARPCPTSPWSRPAASRWIRSPTTSQPARWPSDSAVRWWATRWTAGRSVRWRNAAARRAGGRARRAGSEMSPGLVTAGETMGLVVQGAPGSPRNGEPMTFGMGGSESNVAIGVRRLGLPATWIGRVGADPPGRPHPARAARRAGAGDRRDRSVARPG